MRRGTWFWGILLILIGLLFLAGNMGWLPVEAGKLIWPLVLILIGAWILWAAFVWRPSRDAQEVAIPLEGASRACLRVRHGAGRLRLGAGAGPGTALSGSFAGGLDYHAEREGDALEIKLRGPQGGFPDPWMFVGHAGLNWSFGLNGDVPLSLDLKLGANEARIDLADLRVTDLHLETGASSTDLTLPAHAGYTRAEVHSGVAALKVRVPAGVAARMRIKGGLSGINVDTSRFSRFADVYQSADYDAAQNKVDLEIETGVGSVDVR